ncbi:hypothetical protein Smp_197520 [Schistosoma mansoni]|nr:hypothetical protein Smp_197520 [Schistosoma mansoni]|eukprot:XP_018651330.1 hypothetical protein Smp_197520 [Schistosoma mansoni]
MMTRGLLVYEYYCSDFTNQGKVDKNRQSGIFVGSSSQSKSGP